MWRSSPLRLLELFVARQLGCCLLCGDPAGPHAGICHGCAADLPDLGDLCLGCGQPVFGPRLLTQSCLRCESRERSITQVVAGFRFDHPLDLLVKEAKFGRQLAPARLLGDLLADRLELLVSKRPHTLIPVPLHATRLKERGFNQAVEVAKRVSKQLDIPIRQDIVFRRHATRAQSILSDREARWKNLNNAFALRNVTSLPTHIALVDDVMTSGATLERLAHKLLEHPTVSRVDAWVVCRTANSDH